MIELQPLACADSEQFITDNQEAFNYGVLVEFGRRDDKDEVASLPWCAATTATTRRRISAKGRGIRHV